MNRCLATASIVPRLIGWLCIVGWIGLMVACGREPEDRLQGYIEGEFLYIASPLAGDLETLHVREGAEVGKGELLFSLESTVEEAAVEQAERRVAQARATLEDARKGVRPSELEAIEAQIAQAKSALALSEKELARQEQLAGPIGATTERELDRAQTTRDQNRERVEQLQAELRTARLGARPDQIAAAEANVRALSAELTRAEWSRAQKSQVAPDAALVYDTYYNAGEWVAAGRPVVSLLPPERVKLRVYVPQTWLNALHVGDALEVFVDGADAPVAAKVSFISPRAEFTPPVVYSADNRRKFVYLVEGAFESEDAVQLHPGQPVEVRFTTLRGDE